MKNITGLDGFVWGICIIEDVNDPLFLGRSKARFLYHHTDDKTELPTEDLPWAMPIISIDSMQNVVGLKEGDWCIGFFRDGILLQEPVILGILPGIPETIANPELGFNDPRPDEILEDHQVPRDPEEIIQHDDGSGTIWTEISPKSRYPDERYLKESTFSRLGRNENISETIVEEKRNNRHIGQVGIPEAGHSPGTGSDVASPGGDFSEPEIEYNAKYPYNKVYSSESGHIREIDDTPNFERLHEYHRTGSYKEYLPDGSHVKKIVNDDTEIVLRRKFIHIEASKSETVDWGYKIFVNKDGASGFNFDLHVGAGGDINLQTDSGKLNVNINGDANVKVDGVATVEVTKDLIATVHENANITVKENLRADIGQDIVLKCAGNGTVEIDGNLTTTCKGNVTEYILGNKTTFVLGNYDVIAGETLGHFATKINNLSLTTIDSVAAIGIAEFGSLYISESSAKIYHNAFMTECTGTLSGETTGSAGSAGPIPFITPGALPSYISSIQNSVQEELSLVPSPEDVVQDFQEQIDLRIEISLEDSTSAAESNPNSPLATNSSADGGAGGAGAGGSGGSGGSTGGEQIFGVDPGFLWKPVSESNGRLVVLLPRGTRSGNVSIRDSANNLLDTGKFSGIHNGGREHYRFSKPGSGYPENCKVVYNNVTVTIPNPSNRYEGGGKEPPKVE